MRRHLLPVLIVIYLLSFVSANLIVKHFGGYGLWFSSFLLIPFDYVLRCYLHEKWSGINLIFNLFLLTISSALITIAINYSAVSIALASVAGFTCAQVSAGVFYQMNKERGWFLKVNGSDLLAIVSDSLVFQMIAFGGIDPVITFGQVCIKIAGGFLWYYILFTRIKIQTRI